MRSAKRAHSDAKDWILEQAKEPEKLTLPERNFIVAIGKFYGQMWRYRTMLSALKTMMPVITYIDEIEESLEEGIGWIEDYVNGNLSYKDLSENLADDTASGLEAVLDTQPGLVLQYPKDTPEHIQQALEDLESLADEWCDEIERMGYELHGVLIGAA